MTIVCGDIGTNPREVEIEPIEEPSPIHEPAPERTPEPVAVPA